MEPRDDILPVDRHHAGDALETMGSSLLDHRREGIEESKAANVDAAPRATLIWGQDMTLVD